MFIADDFYAAGYAALFCNYYIIDDLLKSTQRGYIPRA